MEVKPGFRWTEVGLIPEDWTLSTIKQLNLDISDGNYSSKYPKSGEFRDSGIPFIRANNIRNMRVSDDDLRFISDALHVELKKGHLKKNDILVTTRGEIGQIAFVPDRHIDSNINAQLVRINPSGEQLNHRFIAYMLAFDRSQLQFENLQTGSALKQLPVGRLMLLQIPIPPSTSEQEAIAEALSDADALIESLEQLIAKKRQIKQGAMQELLTGKKRLPGFAKSSAYKQTEVGVIPEDWETRPFFALVHVASGQVNPKIEPYRSMILVAPDHIEVGSGLLIKQETAAVQHAISGKYLFTKGDIVYSKIRPYLKKAILATFDGLCSADMYPLKPAPEISAGFVFAAILGHHFSKYAESVSVRSGMPKINRTELAEYSMAVPAIKAEQEAIAAVLTDMDSEIAAIEAKLAKARLVKQGMMQELLTGRIRLI